MKIRLAITALFVALMLPFSTLNVSAGFTGMTLQGNPDGSFSVNGDFISVRYNGDLSPTFESVEISRSTVVPHFESLFGSIDVLDFKPASDPTMSEQSVLVSSSEMGVEFHNNPMVTMKFMASNKSLVSFSLEEEIGAIVDSRHVRLGKEGLTAELIASSEATFEKSFDKILLRMEAGGTCYFRASIIPDEFVGKEISAGAIVGELYLTQVESNVVTDLIQYEPISIAPSFVSSEKVVIDVSGELSGRRVIVLTLDKSMFSIPADTLVVELNGNDIGQVDDLNRILEGGANAFFASENEGTLEVFVPLSHFSKHTVVLSGESKATFPWDSLAVVLGGTVVLLVATAYLFKRRN
ncbi:MAG: hypothetical protein ACE5QF_02235 [Thermoplasmata archaeon]